MRAKPDGKRKRPPPTGVPATTAAHHPPNRPEFDDQRALAEARRGWVDGPGDTFPGNCKFFDQHADDAFARDFTQNADCLFAKAANKQSAGNRTALSYDIIDPLRRTARAMLLRGDLPRAAAAAALLLTATRAGPVGVNAETAARRRLEREKLGHPDSRRRATYAAAERDALAVASECARVPRETQNADETLNHQKKRWNSRSFTTEERVVPKSSQPSTHVSACFVSGDETRLREFANDIAPRGSLTDQNDVLELVVSHLTLPEGSRNAARAVVEARRVKRVAMRRGVGVSSDSVFVFPKLRDILSYARRRCDALVAFTAWVEAASSSAGGGNLVGDTLPKGADGASTKTFPDESATKGSFMAAFMRQGKAHAKATQFNTVKSRQYLSKLTKLNDDARVSLRKLLREVGGGDFVVTTALIRVALFENDVAEALRLALQCTKATPHDTDAALAYAELCALCRRPETGDASDSESDDDSSSSGERDGEHDGDSSSSGSSGDGSSDAGGDGGGDTASDDDGPNARDAGVAKEKGKNTGNNSKYNSKNASAKEASARDDRAAAAAASSTLARLVGLTQVAAAQLAATRCDPGGASAIAGLIVALDDLEDARILGVPTVDEALAEDGCENGSENEHWPTAKDLLEALAQRCETHPRNPGAWWALCRGLVGFKQHERLVERSAVSDVTLKALSLRLKHRRSGCVVSPKIAREVFFGGGFGAPRVEWWPRSLMARDLLLIAGDDGTGDTTESAGKYSAEGTGAGDTTPGDGNKAIPPLSTANRALLTAQAAVAQVLFPNDGFHRLVKRRLNPDTTFAQLTHPFGKKKGAGRDVGGFHGEWLRRGKSALGRSFYDDTVRANELRKGVPCCSPPMEVSRVNSDGGDASCLSLSLDGSEDDESDDTTNLPKVEESTDTAAVRVASKNVRFARKRVLEVTRNASSRDEHKTSAKAAAEKTRVEKDEAVRRETAAAAQKKRKRPSLGIEPTPTWTKKSGKRKDGTTGGALTKPSTEKDVRCKACFYARVSRTRCGSDAAPSFCFLV